MSDPQAPTNPAHAILSALQIDMQVLTQKALAQLVELKSARPAMDVFEQISCLKAYHMWAMVHQADFSGRLNTPEKIRDWLYSHSHEQEVLAFSALDQAYAATLAVKSPSPPPTGS